MNVVSAGWRSKDKENVIANFYSHLNLFFTIVSNVDVEEKEDIFSNLVSELEDTLFSSLSQLDALIFKLIKKLNLPPALSLSLLTFDKDVALLKTTGDGIIFLKRKGKIEKLISNNHSASGYLKHNDIFILTTQALIEKIGGEERIKEALRKNTPQEIVDELMPVLSVLNGFSGTILVLKFVGEAKKINFNLSNYKNHIKLVFQKINKKTLILLSLIIILIFGLAKLRKNIKDKLVNKSNVKPTLTKTLTKKQLKEDKAQEFFTLSLLNEGEVIKDMYLYDKTLFLLTNSPYIYALSTEDKSVEKYKSDVFAKAEKIAANRDGIFVFSEKNGIYKVGKDKTVSLIQKSSDKWGKVIDFATYGGNVYLLTDKNILKFTPITELEYSSALPYFKSEMNFSTATSFAIDKYIYVAFPQRINKYLSGRKEKFSLNNLDEKKYNFDKIFTNKDLDYIYVLDKENKKIYIFNKEGVLQSTIYSSLIPNSSKLAAENKRVFIYFKNKIYFFVK